MYNEMIKEKWIKQKESIKLAEGALIRAFEKIEKYEIRYGKDLSDFSEQEIQDSYASMNFVSIDNIVLHNNYYSQYTQYCIEHNISETGLNNYESFKFERLKELSNKAFRDSTILTRKEVLKMISRLDANIDKFVILGFFEGLYGEYYSDILNLKIQDIDEKNCIFNLERGKFQASKELANIAIAAYEETSYAGVDGNAKISHPYLKSDNIYKSFMQNRATEMKTCGRRVQTKAYKIFKYLDMEYLTIASLVNSGKIYYLNTNFSHEEILNIFRQDISSKGRERTLFEFQYNSVARRSWFRKFEEYLI